MSAVRLYPLLDDASMLDDGGWRLSLGPGEAVLLRQDAQAFERLGERAFSDADLDEPGAIRRSVQARRCEFFHGRLAAARALKAAGCATRQVGRGSAREPLWPQGMRGSISHAADWAVAWVAPVAMCQGLGLDVEPMLTIEGEMAVAAQALSSDEVACCAERVPPGQQRAWRTLVFSAKEALFKAAAPSTGRWLGFDSAECVDWRCLPETDAAVPGAMTGEMHLQLRETLGPELPAGRRLPVRWARLDSICLLTWVAI